MSVCATLNTDAGIPAGSSTRLDSLGIQDGNGNSARIADIESDSADTTFLDRLQAQIALFDSKTAAIDASVESLHLAGSTDSSNGVQNNSSSVNTRAATQSADAASVAIKKTMASSAAHSGASPSERAIGSRLQAGKYLTTDLNSTDRKVARSDSENIEVVQTAFIAADPAQFVQAVPVAAPIEPVVAPIDVDPRVSASADSAVATTTRNSSPAESLNHPITDGGHLQTHPTSPAPVLDSGSAASATPERSATDGQLVSGIAQDQTLMRSGVELGPRRDSGLLELETSHGGMEATEKPTTTEGMVQNTADTAHGAVRNPQAAHIRTRTAAPDVDAQSNDVSTIGNIGAPQQKSVPASSESSDADNSRTMMRSLPLQAGSKQAPRSVEANRRPQLRISSTETLSVGATHAQPNASNAFSTQATAFAHSAENAGSGIYAQTRSSGAANGFSAETTFGALESGAKLDADAASRIRTGHAHAEAGYQDPTLGWVSVRAEASRGVVHATVAPGSSEAMQALSGHMAGLHTYLADNRTPVDLLTLTSLGGNTQQSSGNDFGHGTHQDANNSANQNASQNTNQDPNHDAQQGSAPSSAVTLQLNDRQGSASVSAGTPVLNEAVLHAAPSGSFTGRHFFAVV